MSAWPSPDFVLDSRRLLWSNLVFVAVLVLQFWNWDLELHQGKFSQHLKCNSPKVFVRLLWMVYLDKHPWVSTLRYNQLELSGCWFLFPTIDYQHHQLDERQTHRTLKEYFRIQAFGIHFEYVWSKYPPPKPLISHRSSMLFLEYSRWTQHECWGRW